MASPYGINTGGSNAAPSTCLCGPGAPGPRGRGHGVVLLAGPPTSRVVCSILDGFSAVFSGWRPRIEPHQGLGVNKSRFSVSEYQTSLLANSASVCSAIHALRVLSFEHNSQRKRGGDKYLLVYWCMLSITELWTSDHGSTSVTVLRRLTTSCSGLGWSATTGCTCARTAAVGGISATNVRLMAWGWWWRRW
jgi:hypothetical protein